MPFDSEPRNGDYAGYIDQLVNRGSGTPGEQKFAKAAGGFASKLKTGSTAPEELSPGQQYAPGTGLPSAPTAPPPPSTHLPAGVSEPASQATLAAQGAGMSKALGQLALGGLFIFLTIASIVAAAFSSDPLDGSNIVRTVILAGIANVLLQRGRRAARQAGTQPLSPLPPFVPPTRRGRH